MATSNTTNLNLIKETSAEPIVNHRGHFNDNMDLIDAAYNTLASRSRGQQTWGNLKQNTTWGELIGTNVVAATTTTDNLELIQPGYDSTVDVESFNDNMSILDSTIGAIDVTNDGSIADQLSSVRDSLSDFFRFVSVIMPNTGSVAPGTSKEVTLDMSSYIPSGYELKAAMPGYSGDDGFVWVRAAINIGTNVVAARIFNVASNADSGTPGVMLVCVKNNA